MAHLRSQAPDLWAEHISQLLGWSRSGGWHNGPAAADAVGTPRRSLPDRRVGAARAPALAWVHARTMRKILVPGVCAALLTLAACTSHNTSSPADTSSRFSAASSPTDTSSSYSAAPTPADTHSYSYSYAPAPTNSPTTETPAPQPDTVTYVVTGSSSASVIYGPAGSGSQGQAPMEITKPLGSPLYYSITAQLLGSGSVSCQLDVEGQVISQSTASGGYNIALCEIVDVGGQWTDANAAP